MTRQQSLEDIKTSYQSSHAGIANFTFRIRADENAEPENQIDHNRMICLRKRMEMMEQDIDQLQLLVLSLVN